METRKVKIMENVADIRLAIRELDWNSNYIFKEGIRLLKKFRT